MFRKQDFKKIDLLGSGSQPTNSRQEKYQDLQSRTPTKWQDIRAERNRSQELREAQ